MKKASKIALIILLFCLLVLIRFFENTLFYDPLITFFKGNYLHNQPPVLFEGKLVGFTILRYAMNTVISLAVIYVAFRDWQLLKFSLIFYGVALVVLVLLFLYFLNNLGPENYFIFFYVRRFLIQPLFILLLLPAFYYQKNMKKTDD